MITKQTNKENQTENQEFLIATETDRSTLTKQLVLYPFHLKCSQIWTLFRNIWLLLLLLENLWYMFHSCESKNYFFVTINIILMKLNLC